MRSVNTITSAWVVNAAVLIAGLMLGAGCMVQHDAAYQPPTPPPVETTIVPEAPPPPQTEIAIPSPGPAYVWIPGYWKWQGHWEWVSGSWVIPPHQEAVWVAGYWARTPNGFVWQPGHWR